MDEMHPGVHSDARSYTDFEPRSQWVHGEEADTLIVDASGFRKEQMKVLINTSGSLNISGERPLDGNQWLRFIVRYTVPKDCNPKAIQAKFDKEEGLLYVVLPKKLAQHSPPQEPFPSTKSAFDDAYNAKKDQQNSEDQHGWGAEARHGVAGESSAAQKFGQGMSKLAMGVRQNKLVVGIVVASIIVTVGIVAYLGHRYRRSD